MHLSVRLVAVMTLAVLAGCAAPPAMPPAQMRECAESSSNSDELPLSSIFARAGVEGCFVLLDGNGIIRRYNAPRAGRRFVPASTFKIPNALIAVETGIAGGPDFALSCAEYGLPRQDWWPPAWLRDQTLRTAMRDSVVWYYRELARRIGPSRMQAFLERSDYGNHRISGGEPFWLNGDLRISPDEQVRFLARFYRGRLGVSARSTEIVKSLIVLQETPDWTLSGKTGTMELTQTRELGWLVGYIERGASVDFFALNMEGERVWEDWPPSRRVPLVLEMLHATGLPPASATQPEDRG